VGQGRGVAELREPGMDNANKAVKMAQKRAQVDAVLRCAGLSQWFTQDLEEAAFVATLPAAPRRACYPIENAAVALLLFSVQVRLLEESSVRHDARPHAALPQSLDFDTFGWLAVLVTHAGQGHYVEWVIVVCADDAHGGPPDTTSRLQPS
jgi:hypothetical protein